ncbi:hypothetical protein K502DRAFT_346300 [Neoconidiobolus thromboides FSU 785]|nr:hypothetical protein K502DRAFT_346300 [Neoconidiobolus thromboides FSU 785]
MGLFTRVIGGALVGIGIRSYSLGLQMRPMSSKPSGYFIYAAVGASLGYVLYGLQERQFATIEKRRAKLEERKASREAIAN